MSKQSGTPQPKQKSSTRPKSPTGHQHSHQKPMPSRSPLLQTPEQILLLQRSHGNAFVRRLIDPTIQRKGNTSVQLGMTMKHYQAILKQIRSVTNQELSTKIKTQRILGILRFLKVDELNYLKESEQFKSDFRHMVSGALYNKVMGKMGNLRALGGGSSAPPEALPELDPAMKQFQVDLLNPSIAKQAQTLLQQIKEINGNVKTMTGVASGLADMAEIDEAVKQFVPEGMLKTDANVRIGLKKSTQALALIEQVLTVSDSQMRAKFIKDLQDKWGRSFEGRIVAATDVIKLGAETANQIVSLSSFMLQGVAHLAKRPELIAKAAKYSDFAGKFAGKIGPVVDALSVMNGMYTLLDPKASADDKLKGAVDVASGGLGLYGTIAGSAAAAGLGLSLTINYEGMKLLAKHVYSPIVQSTSWYGVNKQLQSLGSDMKSIAGHFVETAHWYDQYILAESNQQPQALERLQAHVPHLNYEIYNAYNKGLKFIPPLEKYFLKRKRDFEQNLEMATIAQKSGDYASAAMFGMNAAKILIEISQELATPKNQQEILKEAMRYYVKKY